MLDLLHAYTGCPTVGLQHLVLPKETLLVCFSPTHSCDIIFIDLLSVSSRLSVCSLPVLRPCPVPCVFCVDLCLPFHLFVLPDSRDRSSWFWLFIHRVYMRFFTLHHAPTPTFTLQSAYPPYPQPSRARRLGFKYFRHPICVLAISFWLPLSCARTPLPPSLRTVFASRVIVLLFF